jgi:hypothetical protein
MSEFNFKKYIADNPLLSEDLNISKDDMEKLHNDGEVKIDGKKVTFKEEKKEVRPGVRSAAAKLGMAPDHIYDTKKKEKKKVNEVEDRTEALDKLRDILEDLKYMSREANELLSSYFPSAHDRAEAYGALDFGTSSNRYDTTLESIIDGLERGIDVD